MDRTVQSGSKWSLTLFRDGKQGNVSKLSEATFRYGRWADEIDDIKPRLLPSGVVRAIEYSRISEEALESGFELEMSLREPIGPGWMPFDIALSVSTEFGPKFQRPRYIYVSPDDESSLNMVQIALGSCGETPIEPSGRLWIRAVELSMRSLCWALENGILDSEGADHGQLTLALWMDLPAPEKPLKHAELALPGPPSDPYDFFNRRF